VTVSFAPDDLELLDAFVARETSKRKDHNRWSYRPLTRSEACYRALRRIMLQPSTDSAAAAGQPHARPRSKHKPSIPHSHKPGGRASSAGRRLARTARKAVRS
jgi:hypothetical protein